MILSNHYIRQQLGFNGLRGFEALPADIRGYILAVRPENPGETEALLNNSDGLLKVPQLQARWNQAVALSTQIDAIRGDPLAQNLDAQESGAAATLLNALERARNYYPWCNRPWNRGESCQLGLDGALKALDDGLTAYLSTINRLFVAAKDAMDIRAQDQAAQQHKQAEATTTTAAAVAATQENIRATQAAEGAKSAALEAQNVALAVKAQIQSQKAIAEATEPRILGLRQSIAIPIGLGGAALLFFVMRRSGGAAAKPMQGYRRRRRR